MPDEHAAAPPEAAPAKPGHAGGKLRAPGEGMSGQAKNPMVFVVVILVLCVGGWFLVSWMSNTSKLQDCVMSGRKNCVEMDPKLGR